MEWSEGFGVKPEISTRRPLRVRSRSVWGPMIVWGAPSLGGERDGDARLGLLPSRSRPPAPLPERSSAFRFPRVFSLSPRSASLARRPLAPVLSRPTPDAIGPWGLGAGLWAYSHALAPTTIPELAEHPGRWPLRPGARSPQATSGPPAANAASAALPHSPLAQNAAGARGAISFPWQPGSGTGACGLCRQAVSAANPRPAGFPPQGAASMAEPPPLRGGELHHAVARLLTRVEARHGWGARPDPPPTPPAPRPRRRRGACSGGGD